MEAGGSQAAHKANLYDLDTKYADVASLDEVLDYLDGLVAARVGAPL